MTDQLTYTDVTAENVADFGVFCIRNKRAPGYQKKLDWFTNKINKGLRIVMVLDDQGKQLGFIEFIPSELAWRPVKAQNYYFIQCIALFGKDIRNQNIGSMLLNHCEKQARKNKKSGICTMSSDGPWIANSKLFIKNGFEVADQRGRFELLYKALDQKSPIPALKNWELNLQCYEGWYLFYADQCPWHEKSVNDIKQAAINHGIDLKIKQITTPEEAQNGPSGYGTFSLIRDGKELADHYISKTRFENIVKQESKSSFTVL